MFDLVSIFDWRRKRIHVRALWHTRGHHFHQGGRIIFLFKHGTMFTVVVSVEPKVGGLGVRRGVLLEVTFTCTRILENKACLKTSWRGAGNTDREQVENKAASTLLRITYSMSISCRKFTDKRDHWMRQRRMEVKGRGTIQWDTPRATKLRSVDLGNTNVRLGLLATSAADKYSCTRAPAPWRYQDVCHFQTCA